MASLTAAERVEQIKLAIDAKLSGGAIKLIGFPDGRNLSHMTLQELQDALLFWEARALEDTDSARSPRMIRTQSIELGGTP